jgi:hypothetical protein
VCLLYLAHDCGFVTYQMLEPLTSREIDHVNLMDLAGCQGSEIQQVRESSTILSEYLPP